MQIDKLSNRQKRKQFAKHWSIRGLTATLLLIAALLPVASALAINYWLQGAIIWGEVLLELGVACVTLALIAYPAYYLLSWEAEQDDQWHAIRQDFLLLMDQAVDMVILSTPEGLIRQVNQTACDHLGYSKQELLQMSTLDLDIDCHLHRNPELVNALNKGKDINYETIFRKKNGQKIPVESRARVTSWLEEPYYVEFISNISHRREAEEKISLSHETLEKSRNMLEIRIAEHSSEIKKQRQGRQKAEQQIGALQNYLAQLINSMPSAIIALDSNARILQWNLEAEKLTRVLAANAIGKKLTEQFAELDQQISRAKSTLSGSDPIISFRFELKHRASTKNLEVIIYRIHDDHPIDQGEVIRIDDITEKLRIDETLVQTEKMLSLGGLAAGMAHEINNPLGAIVQSTQNIQRRLSEQLPRNHRIAEQNDLNMKQVAQFIQQQSIDKFLNGILESGKRAADIVGDMLSFAKPTSAQSNQVDLIEALDAAVRLSAKDFSRKRKFDFRQIDIRKAYSPHVGLVVAQKNQLEQVFLNLLVNAAQALVEKDDPQQPPLIELIVRREGDTAVAEVIDNGPGMEEDVRKRVFEPFFTTKDEKTGTGLGLSVSYFIIREQLGGDLSVESKPGQGCRFTIRLPLATDDGQQRLMF